MITWFLTTKLGRWLAGISAIIIAILSAWFAGRVKGSRNQKKEDDASQAKANEEAEKQAKQAVEDRAHVDSQVENLPVAPAQQVATADPGTAAGELREWVRKDGG